MAGSPHDDVFLDPLTPLVMLERSARVFPQRPAVVHGDVCLDYAALAREVGRMAGALRRAGVAEGDRVAVLAPNTPSHVAAHFAMPLLGAPLVSINTRLLASEIATILEHSGAKVLLVDAELAPRLDDVVARIPSLERVVEVADAGFPARPGREDWARFADGAEILPVRNTVRDEDSVIAINYTSGTTGTPKGVMYTHRGAYLNASGEVASLGLSKDTVFLWTSPLFHCNGWCMAWAVVAAGGLQVCLRAIDPPRILELIARHRVTNFNGAPTVLLMLSGHPSARGVRFDRPIRVSTGGAPPSPTLIERVERLGIRITHLYGLTETYGPHTLCEMQTEWEGLDAAARARVLARQGVPYPFAVHVRVVDDEMRDVPRDATTMGEVVMRGNNVMRGYYRDPEATAIAFRGGWFHSGDIGVVHPDGYIELRDRSKDIIISGGENISTIEVENLLYGHEAVEEVAVVSTPDEKWGEVPKAFVKLRAEAAVTERELIDWARERLSHFKCPQAVEFCELPKTATGKIQKFKLRSQEWQGRGRRI